MYLNDSLGVCDLGGKVYVIGGWNGQCGMKQCNIFDPVEGKWTEIEPLNYGKLSSRQVFRSNDDSSLRFLT